MSPLLAMSLHLDPASLPSPWALAATFVALFAASFFFSGTETAFFSLQKVDRQRIARSDAPIDTRLNALLGEKTSLITTILMGNETANVTITALGAAVLTVLAPDRPWLNIVIVTPLLILLSEITPKVIAFRYNSRWARMAVWPITILSFVLAPLRIVLTSIVRSLARLFGVTRDAREKTLQEEEFLVLVGQGARAGVVDDLERDIIEAVFELDDMPIGRVMTPRPDIFSVPLEIDWELLLEQARHARFSRIPVWGEDDNDILGVLMVRDLLRHRNRPIRRPAELRKLLHTPVFAPASRNAADMLTDMIRDKVHLAFVADEHGTLMGLITLDDLIGEIVGELGDEQKTDTADIEHREDAISVRASVDLEDFVEETGIHIPEGEYHTLGGYLFHELGRLPVTGDILHTPHVKFVVDAMEGRRITQVLVLPGDDLAEAAG